MLSSTGLAVLRAGFEKILREALQHAAGFVDRDFFGGVEPAGDGGFRHRPVAAADHQREIGARRAGARHIIGLGAVEAERDAAVEGLREELKIVNAKNSGRTHYAGCEENHTLCAVARRLDAALKSAGAEP